MKKTYVSILINHYRGEVSAGISSKNLPLFFYYSRNDLLAALDPKSLLEKIKNPLNINKFSFQCQQLYRDYVFGIFHSCWK